MPRTDSSLIHAPALFDFRNRLDIYFPFLRTSDDLPAAALYKYFPVEFKTLQQTLQRNGHDLSILNLSTILLTYPKLDVDMLMRGYNTRLPMTQILHSLNRGKAKSPSKIWCGSLGTGQFTRTSYPGLEKALDGFDDE